MINLELYRVFVTVAEQGSFTLAAQRLGLTQSAVSQAVHKLEKSLGARLFLRSARGAELSEAGHVLLGHVGGMVRSADAAQAYFVQLNGLEAGNLHIGASDTLCHYVLLPHLKSFHRQYPGITLHITNRTSGETCALLHKGAIDIGFVNLPLEGVDDFEVREIMTLHDCFVCDAGYHAALPGPVPLKALGEHPILMLERQSASRRYLDDWLRRQGCALRPEIELGSLDLLLEFAQAGLGVAAVVREFAIHRLGQGLMEITLEQSPPARNVGMLLRKDAFPSTATKALMAMLLGE